jgi:flagellar basal-body rod protein FlgB
MALINGIFSQPNYVAAKKMLDATALRHEAIASNLANIETPGYKRLEVAGTFKQELSRALAGGNSESMAQLRPQLVVDAEGGGAGPDGNNVQLENELLQLNQNSLAHSIETQLITGNLLKLRLAITGRSS